MAQFWKLDAVTWINPMYIVHAEDNPTSHPPTLHVTLARGIAEEYRERGDEKLFLQLDREARENMLAYLARETETVPPPAPA